MGEIKNPDENNDQGIALQPGYSVGASQKQKEIVERLIGKMNSLFYSTRVKYKLFTEGIQMVISDTTLQGVYYPALKYVCDFLEANGYKTYWVFPTQTGITIVLHKDVIA